jgi:hypothetical protein
MAKDVATVKNIAGGIQPGTGEWKVYWEAHPQHQEAMTIVGKKYKEVTGQTSAVITPEQFKAEATLPPMGAEPLVSYKEIQEIQENNFALGRTAAEEESKAVTTIEGLRQLRLNIPSDVSPEWYQGYIQTLTSKLESIQALDPEAYRLQVEGIAKQMAQDAVEFGRDPIVEFAKESKLWVDETHYGKSAKSMLPKIYKTNDRAHVWRPDIMAEHIKARPAEFPAIKGYNRREDFNGDDLLEYLAGANATKPSDRWQNYMSDAEAALRRENQEIFSSDEETDFINAQLYTLDDGEGGFFNPKQLLTSILGGPRMNDKSMGYFNTGLSFINKSFLGVLYAMKEVHRLAPNILPTEKEILTDMMNLPSDQWVELLKGIPDERQGILMDTALELRKIYNQYYEMVNTARANRGEENIGYWKNFSPVRWQGGTHREIRRRAQHNFSDFFQSAMKRKIKDWQAVKQWSRMNGYKLITDPFTLLSTYMIDSVRNIVGKEFQKWSEDNEDELIKISAEADPVIDTILKIKIKETERAKYKFLPSNKAFFSAEGKTFADIFVILKSQGLLKPGATLNDLAVKIHTYLKDAMVTETHPSFGIVKKVFEKFDPDEQVMKEYFRKVPPELPRIVVDIIERWDREISAGEKMLFTYWLNTRRAIIDWSFVIPLMHMANTGCIAWARWWWDIRKQISIITHAKIKNMTAQERFRVEEEMILLGHMEPARAYEFRRKIYEDTHEIEMLLDKLPFIKDSKVMKVLKAWKDFDRKLLFTKWIGDLSIELYLMKRDEGMKAGLTLEEAAGDAGEIVNDMMGSLNNYVFGPSWKYYLTEVLLMFPRWTVSNLRYVTGAMGPLGSATGPLGKRIFEPLAHYADEKQSKRRMWGYIHILLGEFIWMQITHSIIQLALMAFKNAKKRRDAAKGLVTKPIEPLRLPLQNPGILQKFDIYTGDNKHMISPFFKAFRQLVAYGIGIFDPERLYLNLKGMGNRLFTFLSDYIDKRDEFKGAPLFSTREKDVMGRTMPEGRIVQGIVPKTIKMAASSLTFVGAWLPPGKEYGRSWVGALLALSGAYTYEDLKIPIMSFSPDGTVRSIVEEPVFLGFWDRLKETEKDEWNKQVRQNEGFVTGDLAKKLDKYMKSIGYIKRTLDKQDKEKLKKIDAQKLAAGDKKEREKFIAIISPQFKTGRYATPEAAEKQAGKQYLEVEKGYGFREEP